MGHFPNWKDKAMFKKGSFANKEQYVINMTGVDALHMGVELEAFIRPTRWLDIAAMLSIGDWRWASKYAKGYYEVVVNHSIDNYSKETEIIKSKIRID